MTPTKEQIEAAAKEICIMLATIGDPTPENFAYVALTAAAEVGAMTPTMYPSTKLAIAATIERCAQVADEYAVKAGGFDTPIARAIAAAIRAMKDKP